MKKLEKNGFSLVEVVIATALLGALSLGIMSVNKNMMSGQVTSETKMEELEIRRIITTSMLDQTACQNTLVGANIGDPINQIKSSLGTALFQTASTYGNNSLKILSMNTSDIGPVDAATRDINLNINFQKMKQLAVGTTKNAAIRIRVNATAANAAITGCFVDSTSFNQAMCVTSLGGTWNPATNTCNPIPYVALSGGAAAVMTGSLTGTSASFPGGITSGTITATSLATDNITSGNAVFSGDVTATGTSWATSFQYTSDRRLKKNIVQIENPLEKVLALRGVYFDWKKNNAHDVGFIAQEVKVQIPEIVKYDTNRQINTVDYAKVVPFLVEAIKKQNEEIKKQQIQITELRKALRN